VISIVSSKNNLDLKICKKFLKNLIRLSNENPDVDEFPEATRERIRKYFEEYLTFWGLDVNNSGQLFDLYIDFEKANLERFKRDNDEANITDTTHRIRSIYRRRLSFPHVDLDIVWSEYQMGKIRRGAQ
jgi:hypothetical protein